MLNNSVTEVDKPDAKKMVVTANRSVSSEALFAGRRELLIDHAGEEYRLRLTNQGKLILTK
jgi:hemin uptake protein HemP